MPREKEGQIGGVAIGDIEGGLTGSIIGGRDVNFIQKIYNSVRGDTEQGRAYRNRMNMLQLVWNTWIEGVLKNSLHNEVLIELGMETKPDAVEHPWDMVFQMPDKETKVVPPETTILDLFDQTSGSLLILGEPGSGKTTMLLELARQALERAQENPEQPIPVVFNLSSWKPKFTISDWLVQELRDKYHVPKKDGQPWVESDYLLLLLDGLDEVQAADREPCIQAINFFRAEHNMTLAICSRRQEYEDQSVHLKLRGAVNIRPLTAEQVDDYMEKARPWLEKVHRALREDPELVGFAKTPLVLSIITMTYRDASAEAIEGLEMAGNKHQHLFDVYIQEMFRRKGTAMHYPQEKMKSWLAWLASRMVKKEGVFNVEDIRFGWLPTDSNRKRRMIFGLVYGLIMGLVLGLVFGLVMGLIMGLEAYLFYDWVSISGRIYILLGELIPWLLGGIFFGPVLGLVLGLVYGFPKFDIRTNPIDKLAWRWKTSAQFILIFGLVYGPVFVLLRGPIGGLLDLPVGWLAFGMAFGMTAVLIGEQKRSEIKQRKTTGAGTRFYIKNTLVKRLLYGLLSGLFSGLVFGLMGRWTEELHTEPLLGPSFVFTMALLSGLKGSEIEQRNTPGAGIRSSMKNALIFGLLGGLLFGFFVLVGGLSDGPSGSLIFGISFGLMCMLGPGGAYLFDHFTYRFLLSRAGNIPWNVVDFLDYAKQLIFMHRVGGGYIFIHRLLMEHFAALWDENTSSVIP